MSTKIKLGIILSHSSIIRSHGRTNVSMSINKRIQQRRFRAKEMQKSRINIMTLSAVFILLISGIGFAYAQESTSANQFYTPGTEGLTTFANNVAESVPKIVAAVILF